MSDDLFWSVRVRDVADLVPGIIELGSNQLVKTGVNTGDRSAAHLLQHVDPGQEDTAFSDQVSSRLEPQL